MNKTIFGILVSGMAAALHAAPILFQDIYNPADKMLNAGTNSHSLTFTHNILDNGFLPSQHAITSAKLTLNLYDDDQDRFFLFDQEFAFVTADNSLLSIFEVDGSRQFTVSSALLQYDGKLEVTVKAIAGDFLFKSSQLDVQASVAAVPEPGTMALTGLGLLALGWAARKRKKS